MDAALRPARRPVARRLLGALVVAMLGLGLVVVGGVILGGGQPDPATTGGAASTGAAQDAVAPTGTDALSAEIATRQEHLRIRPGDAVGWATLALDYVQQAKATADPSYYAKAQGALRTAEQLQSSENFVADAGEAALASARHDFAAARTWAQRGLAIDPYNATLYGALDDADTQLGRYAEADAAVEKMLSIRPGAPAFTRAEYADELRGRAALARGALQQALALSPTPADRAFSDYYLAQLSFDGGDAADALRQVAAGLRDDPASPQLLELRAKAEAALGRTAAALADYAAVTARLPQPEFVLEYADLLESLGRHAQAQQQYLLFLTEERLFEAGGVALDTDPTLYYAEHGNPAEALRYGRQGLRIRPFIEMQDAYAWALHAAHRDAEALRYERKAMSLGTRSALFRYHAGMIERSLGHAADARRQLSAALAINPHFSPLLAPRAAAALRALGGPAPSSRG